MNGNAIDVNVMQIWKRSQEIRSNMSTVDDLLKDEAQVVSVL